MDSDRHVLLSLFFITNYFHHSDISSAEGYYLKINTCNTMPFQFTCIWKKEYSNTKVFQMPKMKLRAKQKVKEFYNHE